MNLERYGVDFFKYFDVTTRSMTFKLMRSQTPTGSLGILGYLFRLLELAGFSLGRIVHSHHAAGEALLRSLPDLHAPGCPLVAALVGAHAKGL